MALQVLTQHSCHRESYEVLNHLMINMFFGFGALMSARLLNFKTGQLPQPNIHFLVLVLLFLLEETNFLFTIQAQISFEI